MLTLGSGTWQKTAIFWLHCHARSKRWRETSVGTSFVFENIILLNAFSFIVIICFKPLTWWEEAQHCMCSQTNIAPLLTSSSGKELENDIRHSFPHTTLNFLILSQMPGLIKAEKNDLNIFYSLSKKQISLQPEQTLFKSKIFRVHASTECKQFYCQEDDVIITQTLMITYCKHACAWI